LLPFRQSTGVDEFPAAGILPEFDDRQISGTNEHQSLLCRCLGVLNTLSTAWDRHPRNKLNWAQIGLASGEQIISSKGMADGRENANTSDVSLVVLQDPSLKFMPNGIF